MRKVFAALAVVFAIFLAPPAKATEIVFTASDQAHVVALATVLGYYDARSRTVSAAGRVAAGGAYQIAWNNGDGSLYQPTGATTKDSFGNTVPVMAQVTGIFGRLRHNADPLSLEALMALIPANSGVTIYRQYTDKDGVSYWSSDGGTTHAPDYIATVGLML